MVVHVSDNRKLINHVYFFPAEARRQSKRRGRPKGSRNGARKRPIDPSQPWLESSDSDEPNVGLEDELDDDEYFRRLEEEKMREDAEEVSRKRRVGLIIFSPFLIFLVSHIDCA